MCSRSSRADLRCAWEFRHDSWFADDVYDALRTGNAALCVADTENGHTPLIATADFGYFRLRDEGYTKPAARAAGRVGESARQAAERRLRILQARGIGMGPKLALKFAGLF